LTRNAAPRFAARLVLLALAFGGAPAVPQTPDSGRPLDRGVVTRVSDGDTIRVKFDDGQTRRVRLIGVDTPERADRRESGRYWAEMATRFVVHQLLDKRIRLSYDEEKEDRFGRTLAYIWTEDGELFNERLVRRGFSLAFLTYPFRRDYQDLFRKAQDQAKREGLGLWSRSGPPSVDVAAARGHLGEYITVRFRCARSVAGRTYVFLWTGDRRFQVLMLNTIVWPQPAVAYFEGKELSVTGILEEQKGSLKMYVLFAGQVSRF
jgi:micrococcal nuclease